MKKFSQKQHLISSLPCHPKDIQLHILRHQKYVKSLPQVLDSEEIPSHLISRLLRDAKRIKMLQKVTLKWNYQPSQIKPEIVKSLVKTHSRSLKTLSLDISSLILPYHFRNIFAPLKKIRILTLANNPHEIKSLDRLRTLQALSFQFGYDTIEPQVILRSLSRLPSLSEVHTLSTSKSLEKILLVSEHFSRSTARQVKFHITTEGDQEYSKIPQLSSQAQENITSLHFQAVQFTSLFDDISRKAPLLFENLKNLSLNFKCLGLRAAEWFLHLKAFSQLETLSLDFIGHQDNILSHESLQQFSLPKSLKSLELKGLVSFSELLETPQDFACFLSNFRGMNELRNLSFEFELFEEFQPSYTTFFVSLVQLLPSLSSLNLNVYSMVFHNEDQEDISFSQPNYYFDLAPFLAACSNLKNLQQLKLCMPNFFFEDAVIISPLPELQALSLRVLEDENTFGNYNNITKSLDKLIKSVSLSSPNLNELILDFPEVIEEDEILSRCRLLREFQSLRSLGVKLSVPTCSEYTVRGMGEMLNSAVKLENLFVRFFESDHSLFKLKEYLKHHKSVRKMLVYLDSSNLFDNDGLMNELEAEFKDLGSFVSENSPDNNNDDLFLNLQRP